MPKKLTIEEFIDKARKIHGDKYDYSKVEYKNNYTKVCIVCSEHGEFWQTPNAHLNGHGCPKCGSVKAHGAIRGRMTTEEFIEKARIIHGDKYDYSKSKYINAKTNVIIACPKHGIFNQNPSMHLTGRGCPKCGIEKMKNAQKSTLEEFIRKAKKVHGDTYDYSKVEYINSQTPVKIICKEHGTFSMRPNDHLSGQGCYKCSLIKVSKKFAFTTEQFIGRARGIHGDKYDYSKVEYKNNRTKVCIICPEHGEFWQTPDKHLQGEGCPKCKSSVLENKIKLCLKNNGIIFFERHHFEWLHKKHLDFYLPEYNVAIECQGEQHFTPVSVFGGTKGFEETKRRDKEKNELCKKNNIKLLYYSNLKEHNSFLGEELIKDEETLINKIIVPEKEK